MTKPGITFFQSAVASSTAAILLPKVISYLPLPNFFKLAARVGSLGMLVGSIASQYSVYSLKKSKAVEHSETWREKAFDAIAAVESIALPLLISQVVVLDNLCNGALVLTAGVIFALTHRQMNALNKNTA